MMNPRIDRRWLASWAQTRRRRRALLVPEPPVPVSLLTRLLGYYDFADGSFASHAVMDDLVETEDSAGPPTLGTAPFGWAAFDDANGAQMEAGGYWINGYPFSYTCWMLHNESTATWVPPFALFGYGTNQAQVQLVYYDADSVWAYLVDDFRNGLGWFGTLADGLVDDVFHQFTLVFTPDRVAVHVDGQLTGTFAHTTPCPALDKLSLGWRWIDWFRQRGNLKVGNIGIWNRALTADEVTQLYNGGLGLDYASL